MDIFGAVMAFLIVAGVGALFGSIVWMESPGYTIRAAAKKKRNQLQLERERRELEIDLRIREWQATASLEDLTRHRERLESSLDHLHQKGTDDG